MPACSRCGSTERRRANKGCAPCSRLGQARYRQRLRDLAVARLLAAPDDDIPLTGPMRDYLRAFDVWLKEPSRTATIARHAALRRLEGGTK